MTQSQAKSAIASVTSSMNKKNASKQRISEENSSLKKDNLQEETARQIIAQMIQETEQKTENFMNDVQENDYTQQKSTAHIVEEIVQNAVEHSALMSNISSNNISQNTQDNMTIAPDAQNPLENDIHSFDAQETGNTQQEEIYQKQEDSFNTNIFFQNNIIDMVRENIEKIHNHSFAFADNIHDSRVSARHSASIVQETTLDGVSNISSAYFDAVSKSVCSETPTDFISHQMECVSKIQKAYSDMFSIIGKESYKTWRETLSLFIMPKC